ncbi:MAG: hypothetical protein V3S33_06670 [Gammaproteobacteria bacterium]
MANTSQHPTPEQLDRLRAGLLDEEMDTATILEAHIPNCPECQDYLRGWTRMQELAQSSEGNQALLASRLREAREAALSTAAPAKKPLPHPALAIAASLMLVAGLLLWSPWSALDIAPNQMAQHQEEQGPGLYEDLDFYIWLAGHQDSSIATENNHVAHA